MSIANSIAPVVSVHARAGAAPFVERSVIPASSDLPPGVARTFSGGKVVPSLTRSEITLYRVWGGQAGRVGPYLTWVRPASARQAMQDLALDPAWGNSTVFVSEVKVPEGTPIYEGTAAPQGALNGGGSQVYVPREWLRDPMFGPGEPLR